VKLWPVLLAFAAGLVIGFTCGVLAHVWLTL